MKGDRAIRDWEYGLMGLGPTKDLGPVALTAGVVMGPVLNLSKSVQINIMLNDGSQDQ